MNILHLNSNYKQSSIYPRMIKSINKLLNIHGRVYYPVNNLNKLVNNKDEFLDMSECLGKFDRYFYFRRNRILCKDVQRIYGIKDYSLLLAYSLFSNGYLAYELNKKYKIPYVVIIQNTDVNMYFKKFFFLRWVGRNILRNAYMVVFISKPYQEHVLNEYLNSADKDYIRKKSVVIPFGIDDFWFNNQFKKIKSLNNNEIKLLYVGKLNLNKNVMTTIKVSEYLIKMGYEVSYTVVGDIEDNEIGNLLKRYNFINYIPFVDKEELLEIYRKNEIFIMPSIRESFGLVYAEAMSQGLPVIYTRGQGFDGHFNDGEIGYSVESFNVEEIAKKIILIKENYSQISYNCREKVNKFRWSNIVSQYNRIFEEVNK